jgi:hypothetical protein
MNEHYDGAHVKKAFATPRAAYCNRKSSKDLMRCEVGTPNYKADESAQWPALASPVIFQGG